ncbi:hypothetical protein HDA40_002244 [Hamadaea flava]|uniref:Uncharacterized protein n=1 Tax=Hamadaea flava TaxID=1742688 RepID=A0ABV8LKF1_9ACTN|nr:hypothetical protein [Hamadaea flava]MCP2323737.1 hypothetical protein [Hamadaea flava]
MTVEQIGQLHRAREAAKESAKAARRLAEFLETAPAGPDDAQLTEFITLLAREEATRAERDEACASAGYQAPSVE